MLGKILGALFGIGSYSRTTVGQQTEDLIKRDWEKVEIALREKNPAQLKQAMIKADKSLDNALKDIVPGDTMGERLKEAKDKFDPHTYNKVWEAHKVRNALVHESGYEPPYYVLTQSIESLKNGLYVLGVRL